MEKLNNTKLKLTLIFLVVTTLANAGGGWTQKKGEGYFKLSEWWLVADQHYTDKGLIDPNATLGIYNTSIYAEYGFTDKFTGIIYMPFLSTATINGQVSATTGNKISEGGAIHTFGDTDIALKYSLGKFKQFNFATKLQLGLPLGNKSGGANNNLQTGDGEFNQLVQLDIGFPIKVPKTDKIALYGNAYAAFNNRTNDFSDEFRFGFEGGIGFKDKTVWFIYKMNNLQSLNNGTPAGLTTASIFANNTEFASVAYEVAVKFYKNWGLSAEYATATSGRLILARPSYSVGIFYDMKK